MTSRGRRKMTTAERIAIQLAAFEVAQALWGNGVAIARALGKPDTTGAGWESNGNGIPMRHVAELVKLADDVGENRLDDARAKIQEARELLRRREQALVKLAELRQKMKIGEGSGEDDA